MMSDPGFVRDIADSAMRCYGLCSDDVTAENIRSAVTAAFYDVISSKQFTDYIRTKVNESD